jgi:hypothetical protein
LTRDKQLAGEWAEGKYPGKPISVFKLDLSKSLHNIKEPYHGNYKHIGDIAPHFIRGVSKHKRVTD